MRMSFANGSVLKVLCILGILNFSCDSAEQQPNILLFVVDDLGWQDTSVPFDQVTSELNRHFQTPNMQRLANQGMRFTQAYAYGNCTPSRVSLMTGMNAARHRVTNWTRYPDELNPAESSDSVLNYPMWNVNGLNPITPAVHSIYATPLPELLKHAGYKTIHVGKAHFGAHGTPGADPLNLGFQVNIAGHAAGAPGSYYAEEHYGEAADEWAVPGLEDSYEDGLFLTEALTQKAKFEIKKAITEDKPFFLNMAHYAVHTPIQSDPRFFDKYLQTGLDSIEASYASLVEGMDKSLGDLMDLLEEEGIDDNTIILFISDNGGLTNSPPRGFSSRGHNYPLACGKSTPYEGGIRVPMMVKWPGKELASVNESLVHIQDLFPTIMKMASLSNANIDQAIDGLDLTDLMINPEQKVTNRTLIWNFPNHTGWLPQDQCSWGPYSVIRKGEWKLIYFHTDQTFELYHLAVDLSEANNLVDENEEKAVELAQELSTQLIEMKAQFPTFKASGRKVSLPIDALTNNQELLNN